MGGAVAGGGVDTAGAAAEDGGPGLASLFGSGSAEVQCDARPLPRFHCLSLLEVQGTSVAVLQKI